MRAIKLFVLVVLIFSMAACNTEQKKLQKTIALTEEKTDKTNLESATALAKLYEEYAERYKKDKLAPTYLFKAAELYQNTGNFTKSIELFDLLAERYPADEKAGDAMFFKGFIYENMLGDTKRAKEAYEYFLAKYPNHKMAESTKQNLPYIGKMPDFVKELEQTNDTLTVADTLEQLEN